MDWKGWSRCLASQIPRSNTIGLLSLGLHEGESVKMERARREELVAKINTTEMERRHRGLGNVSERSDSVLKHVFVREVDILSICSSQPLELVGARKDKRLNNWLNTNSWIQNLATKWPRNQVRKDTCYICITRKWRRIRKKCIRYFCSK